jgi:hypothetical protein
MPRSSLIAAALLAAGALASAGEAKVNPTAELKIADKKVLWQSGENTGQAGRARFSPDGKRLAWITGGNRKPAADAKADPKAPPPPAVPAKGAGQVLVADVESGKVSAVWEPAAPGTVYELAWSQAGDLAGCVRWGKAGEDGSGSGLVLLAAGAEKAKLLAGTDGAKALAWRGDSKAIAFSTDNGLLVYDLAAGKAAKLLDAGKDWRPKGATAFEELTFCGERVIARQSGTMRWFLDGGELSPKVEFRAVVPSPDGRRLYLVPWLVGPTKIPRGAGLVWLDLDLEKIALGTVVPGIPAGGGAGTGGGGESATRPYWLVDVWDWHYYSTLRVAADGKTLTFCGVKAGELSANAWREFCVWQVPADGSAAPKALCEMGPIFKRIDASGRDWAIGWRYDLDRATVLADIVRGRAWRIPEEAGAMREQTDVRLDKLLVATARGEDVLLVRLEAK